MTYDKDKRNLRQRCGRFLKKNGVVKTDDFFMLELPSEHARRLLGTEWRETRMTVPLGTLPQESVVALQGMSLLAMNVIPNTDSLLCILRNRSEDKEFHPLAADMLYHFGLARDWFADRLPRIIPNGLPVQIGGESILELLRTYKKADVKEIVEQYMYLR